MNLIYDLIYENVINLPPSGHTVYSLHEFIKYEYSPATHVFLFNNWHLSVIIEKCAPPPHGLCITFTHLVTVFTNLPYGCLSLAKSFWLSDKI